MSIPYPTEFPGFGNPVNDDVPGPYHSCLGEDSLRLPIITLGERCMLEFMNAVTDKPQWFDKIKDAEILSKWRKEAKEFRPSSGVLMSDRMFNWCILELGNNAADIDDPSDPPPTFVFNGDVYKSDTALSLSFKKRLQDAVLDFEASIPEDKKDWHPNTDEKVWDLVHPSLFPVLYGRSRVLPGDATLRLDDCISRCGEGVILPVPHGWEAPSPTYSRAFQWLPCEVDISGHKARITTYVNNLHPVHQKTLYDLLEEIITAAIPLWELSLAPSDDSQTIDTRITYNQLVHVVNSREWPDEVGVQREIGEKADDFEYGERRPLWVTETMLYKVPQPPRDFEPLYRADPIDFKESFQDRGLQVIIKLANIHLTPNKPTYNGGSWHIEGQLASLNERIVASAIYYYSNENVTESRLSFRNTVNPEDLHDISYEQGEHAWLTSIFGVQNDEAAVQEAGSVVTREGRLITFPNIVQHRVEGFRLQDPSKPGHRKIVALFLVNPHVKILSSAKIPCQRKDWWEEYQANNPKAISVEWEGSHSFVDFPLGMDEAKELRLKLMEERSFFDRNQEKTIKRTSFNLCEH